MVQLASTQSGDRASLTRKSFTKADIFVCIKKETDPKMVITDITCTDMGREVFGALQWCVKVTWIC